MTSFDQDLERLLAAFDPSIRALAVELIELVSSCQPELMGKVQFGWRSVNFRHPKAGFVCAIFPYADRVSLIFEHGRLLESGTGLLEGEGSRVRFIPFRAGAPLPVDEIAILLAEAIALRA